MEFVLTTALAVAAALVALAFAGSTFERWLVKRKPQDLSWSISLLFFVLGAVGLAWGSSSGWSGASFRTFYAFGAVINVPFLAAGQLQLQLHPRRSSLVLWVTTVFCAVAFGVVYAAPFTKPVDGPELPQGRAVFGVGPRVFAAIGSGVAATIVFVGTIIGIMNIVRNRASVPRATHRILGLALLAVGTATLSASGLLNSVFGEMRAFAITLTVGVVFLFAGFLCSSGSAAVRNVSALHTNASTGSAEGASKNLALQSLR